MKKRTIIVLIIILVVVILIIAVAHSPATSMAPSGPAAETSLPDAGSLLANATYSFYGDTFTLAAGQATIQGHAFAATSTGASTATSASTTMPLVPVGYTLAATSTGTITTSGQPGAVAVLYREFGADIDEPVIFAFSQNADGSVQQVAASDIVDEEDAQVESVSLNGGTTTLNLLVVSAADQQKPHYEQTPTQPETLQFTISGTRLVPLSQ